MMTEKEYAGSGFGFSGRYKKIDDIPVVIDDNQTMIFRKKCKKTKTIKVYGVFKNEFGPQMEKLQEIPDD